MAKVSYFFEKKAAKIDEEEKLNSYFYIYKGYKINNEDTNKEAKTKEEYPIILFFKKDELAICFKYENIFKKIFTLSIKPGKLNQIEFEKKFEHYWKMPLWEPPINQSANTNNNKKIQLEVDISTLITGYYNEYYEFTIKNNIFCTQKLFASDRSDVKIGEKGKKITFYYEDGNFEEVWKIESNKVFTNHINFRKIFLDFLYELNNLHTFDDENFYSVQPALTNNNLLYALIYKCRYIDALARIKSDYYRDEIHTKGLPKVFKEAEKNWINICTVDKYRAIFTSKNSIFFPPEKEIDLVIFKSILDKQNSNRKSFYTEEDAYIWNRVTYFYMTQYSLWKSFKLLFSNMKLLLCLFIFEILGIIVCGIKECFIFPAYFYLYIFPGIICLVYLLFYYKKNLNLFKLLLPRLSLGILFGWLFFATSGEELWRFALYQNSTTLSALIVFLFLVIFVYIVTDIKNKIIINPQWIYKKSFLNIRKLDLTVFKRTTFLMLIAIVISLIQGIYVCSLFMPPLMEQAKIINEAIGKSNDNDKIYKIENLSKIEKIEKKYYTFKDLFSQSFHHTKIYNFYKNIKVVYIWSILASQCLLSILIGVILQFLWEDRPITEPL